MKKFSEWAKENLNELTAAVPGQDDDAELDVLNSQMQKLMQRLTFLISKTHNKNKGYAILHQIGKAVQDATNMSDINAKKALFGQMPSQRNLG